LQELEDMATRLLATVRQIQPGQERHEVLEQIGKIRLEIAALQPLDSPPARRGSKGEGETTDPLQVDNRLRAILSSWHLSPRYRSEALTQLHVRPVPFSHWRELDREA